LPAVTDPYVARLTVFGHILTEEAINVFHYAAPTFAAGVSDLNTEFQAEVVPSWLAAVSGNYRMDSINIQMVRGSTAFGTFIVGLTGLTSGEVLPPSDSWDFTLVRGGGGERNGYKRLAGVPESLQNGGVAVSGALPGLALVANAFAEVLGSDLWAPVIEREYIGKVRQIPPKYYDVSGVIYSKIGTQNSRKYGHGR